MRVLTLMASGARGGGADHLAGILPELRRLGHEGPVVVGTDGPLAARLTAAGFEVSTLELMGSRASVGGGRALTGRIRSAGVDIVHAHGTRAGFYCAVTHLGWRGVPWVYTAHGLSYRRAVRLPGAGPLVRAPFVAAEGLICRSAARVVSVSAADLADLARRRLLDPERGVHIPNAVDTVRFSPPDGSRRARARASLGVSDPGVCVVGTVSRLVPQKSVSDLVDAVASVPRVRAVVIGDGPQGRGLRRRAEPLGDRMQWLGARDDVAELIAGFDVFVLTSRWEGEPIALLEAMAAGVPVIATATEGAREIIDDGDDGRLVPVGDVRAIARGIAELVDSPGERERLGHAARRKMEQRSWARAAASLAEVYEQVGSVAGNRPVR